CNLGHAAFPARLTVIACLAERSRTNGTHWIRRSLTRESFSHSLPALVTWHFSDPSQSLSLLQKCAFLAIIGSAGHLPGLFTRRTLFHTCRTIICNLGHGAFPAGLTVIPCLAEQSCTNGTHWIRRSLTRV
ncbi:hypothetical protein M513_11867, partial [Trichuris suis]